MNHDHHDYIYVPPLLTSSIQRANVLVDEETITEYESSGQLTRTDLSGSLGKSEGRVFLASSIGV
jgi:hypothetical protein